ncbi:hypothetical protein [Ruegeria atlantica]|uniref:hypothetical protein n=1 Tax=Ruegeria atlantica TaxID=81569 RepID=UPI001C2B963E|nr:hypothetical protein [Ruegeria atlantica]
MAQKADESSTEFHTEYFEVTVFDGLDGSLARALRQDLDACAQATDVLKFREGVNRIPFFVAPDYQQLDDALDKRFAGEITFIEDGLIKDIACGPNSDGNLFVSSDTISFCMVNKEFWRSVIDRGEFCPYVAHELVHIIQNELVGGGFRRPGQSLSEVVGPAWLFEGVAVLFAYLSRLSEEKLEHLVRLTREKIPPGSMKISELERFEDRLQYNKLHYQKGFVAAEFLLRRSGKSSFFLFYKCIGENEQWQNCFERSFNLSVENFYAIHSLR